jgi:hypothetical protein
MEIKKDTIYTFKLNSGEELVANVEEVHDDHYMIYKPVSIAPGQQGMQMIPSAFTMELDKNVRLNINAITMVFETNPDVVKSYKQATSNIVTPDKQILKG